MYNGQQYRHQSGPPPPGTRMDLISQGPPRVGHAPNQQHSYIPHGSFQNQVPPPAAGSAFQDNPLLETEFNQLPTSAGTFHSHRFPPPPPPPPPPPDFSQPPPPFSSSSDFMYSQTEVHPRVEFHPYQNVDSFSSPSHPHVRFSHPGLTAYNEKIGPMVSESVPFHPTEMEATTSEDPSISSGEDKELMWLRNFEQRIIGKSIRLQESVTAKEKTLKIADVQQLVIRSRLLSEQLCQLTESMNHLSSSVDEDIWNKLAKKAEDTKLELEGITQKFQDKSFVEDVKRLIHQRRKKRNRNRRQHKQNVGQKKELQMQWKKEEKKIDAWREKLRLEEEERRREIAIKAEADSILGEVRQKQIDGVKMQQLLEKLTSLRIARLNKGTAHGFVSTPQKDQLFSTTLDKIAEVVKSQMVEYKLEEQTLRVMMEESTSYKRSNAGRDPKEAFSRLEIQMKKAIFGDIAPIDQKICDDSTAADHSLEVFLQRRHEWDKFICDEDLPLASSVPLSWVVPPTHPTPLWAKYQS